VLHLVMLMHRAPAARRASYSGKGVQTRHYLPIKATTCILAHPSKVAVRQSLQGYGRGRRPLWHLILSIQFFYLSIFYLSRLKKTPISWYTSYAVGELAFPSRGGDGLTHDDVNTLLAFLQLLVSIAALLKD
jgi:hypothetical protein